MSQFPEEPLSETGFGYFPVSPSQTLKNGHYKVIRKLGWGPRSSVWLATFLDGIVTKYCVIKILTVQATNEHRDLPPEIKALQAVSKNAGYHRLPCLHDNFSESSAHGNHFCIVFWDILPDIDTTFRLTSPDKYLRVHIVKKIIASIREPLVGLHQAGFFHGAVKPDNFSFRIPSVPEYLEPKLAKLPPMDCRPPAVVDGTEYHIIISQPLLHGNSWEDEPIDVAQYSVYLNNLGHARRPNKHAKWDTRKPSSLRPPELILDLKGSLNQKVDVWMLGCATFLLLTGEQLFAPEPQDDADHLAHIMKLRGETFDPAAWEGSSRYDEFFLPSGQPKFDLTNGTLTLEKRLHSLSCLSADDVKPAAEFIAYCLTVDPAKRPTLQMLEKHAWLAVGYICTCGFDCDEGC